MMRKQRQHRGPVRNRPGRERGAAGSGLRVIVAAVLATVGVPWLIVWASPIIISPPPNVPGDAAPVTEPAGAPVTEHSQPEPAGPVGTAPLTTRPAEAAPPATGRELSGEPFPPGGLRAVPQPDETVLIVAAAEWELTDRDREGLRLFDLGHRHIGPALTALEQYWRGTALGVPNPSPLPAGLLRDVGNLTEWVPALTRLAEQQHADAPTLLARREWEQRADIARRLADHYHQRDGFRFLAGGQPIPPAGEPPWKTAARH